MVQIENKDNTSLARAIAVGRFHCLKPNPLDRDKYTLWKRYWEQLRQGDVQRHTLQRREAHALMQQAGCDPQRESGPEEWHRFQTVLSPLYRLKIYELDTTTKRLRLKPLYRGKGSGFPIHILYDDHHYDCIVSMSGFLDHNYYCNLCDVGYEHVGDHRCPQYSLALGVCIPDKVKTLSVAPGVCIPDKVKTPRTLPRILKNYRYREKLTLELDKIQKRLCAGARS